MEDEVEERVSMSVRCRPAKLQEKKKMQKGSLLVSFWTLVSTVTPLKCVWTWKQVTVTDSLCHPIL